MKPHEAQLPANWASTEISAVCDIISGYGFPEALQGKTEGEIPFYKVGDISNAWKRNVIHLEEASHYISQAEADSLNARNLPPFTTVFAKIGAAIALNRRAMLSVSALVDNNVMGLHPNQVALNPAYLFYFTCTLRLNEISQATTVPSIRKSDVEQIRLPLPPIQEQRRIVAEIEKQFTRLDAAVAALKRVQANLKRYRASVLKAACEGRLTVDWRALNSQRKPVEEVWSALRMPKTETTDLPILPDTWSWYRLKNISRRVSVGHVGPTSEFYCQSQVGVPFVRSQNVRPGRLDFEGMQYITPEFHRRLKKSTLAAGDLLVVRVGANRGDTCSVPDGLGELNCANIVFARPHEGLSTYLEAYCQSQMGQQLLLGMTTGSAQGVLNTKSVAELPVPIPPSEEREEILGRLIHLDILSERTDKLISDTISRAERLRQSILKRAFEGKLVPQDPNDEPASVLLERIRAARARRDETSNGNRARRQKSPRNQLASV